MANNNSQLIGYARVSTKDQRLDMQLDALKQAGVTRTFTDEGVSGTKFGSERPGLEQALSHLRAGDTLVIWKLDRLGRTSQKVQELITELDARGVHFRSLNDPIDTSTPAGRFLLNVLAAFSEMERDTIRERVLTGLQAARSRGRVGGRSAKLSKSQVKALRAAVAAKELTMKEVADTFGISRASVYRYLEVSA